MAAGVGGSTSIYISANAGATWKAATLPGTYSFVCMSAAGNTIVVSGSGALYISSDYGVTWTTRTSSYAVRAMSADGVRLLGPNNTDQTVGVSADQGVSWTSPFATPCTCMACSANGKYMAAARGPFYSTNTPIYVSSDYGNSWTARESSRDWEAMTCTPDGSTFFAIAYSTGPTASTLYTSHDFGASWTAGTANQFGYGAYLKHVIRCTADGGFLAAVTGGTDSPMVVSKDGGQNWQDSGLVFDDFNDLCMSDDGQRIALSNYLSISTSNPGPIKVCYVKNPRTQTTVGTSGSLRGNPGSAVELQYIGNNQFQPISITGTVRGY
jgi:photosystem II stability/assembly factor-like uncharacterized protein